MDVWTKQHYTVYIYFVYLFICTIKNNTSTQQERLKMLSRACEVNEELKKKPNKQIKSQQKVNERLGN